MLLQERDQEIDSQVNVLHQLIFVHFEVSDGNAQAQNLEENLQFIEDGFHREYIKRVPKVGTVIVMSRKEVNVKFK